MNDPSRAGAAQPKRFDPARAARLDDPARFAYLPPAEIIALLDLADGSLLLDFGAGTGAYAIAIARARPGVRILALDEQPAMLDLLRANTNAAQLTTIEPATPPDLAGVRGSVDRILALNVLHELGDAALADIGPLLRRGGFALFIDWNGDVERPHGPPRDHVYGVADARARLLAAGMHVTAAQLFPYHYALRCAPLAHRPASFSTTP